MKKFILAFGFLILFASFLFFHSTKSNAVESSSYKCYGSCYSSLKNCNTNCRPAIGKDCILSSYQNGCTWGPAYKCCDVPVTPTVTPTKTPTPTPTPTKTVFVIATLTPTPTFTLTPTPTPALITTTFRFQVATYDVWNPAVSLPCSSNSFTLWASPDNSSWSYLNYDMIGCSQSYTFRDYDPSYWKYFMVEVYPPPGWRADRHCIPSCEFPQKIVDPFGPNFTIRSSSQVVFNVSNIINSTYDPGVVFGETSNLTPTSYPTPTPTPTQNSKFGPSLFPTPPRD